MWRGDAKVQSLMHTLVALDSLKELIERGQTRDGEEEVQVKGEPKKEEEEEVQTRLPVQTASAAVHTQAADGVKGEPREEEEEVRQATPSVQTALPVQAASAAVHTQAADGDGSLEPCLQQGVETEAASAAVQTQTAVGDGSLEEWLQPGVQTEAETMQAVNVKIGEFYFCIHLDFGFKNTYPTALLDLK